MADRGSWRLMAITGFELWQVASEYVTADLIVWKRYRNKAIGIVETMLDANPQLAFCHRVSPFIPVGTFVRVPIDPDLIAGKPQVKSQDSLWTDKQGYTV
jgi:phage tail protein X